MSNRGNQQTALSLRLRLVVLVILLLSVSLSLVGFALDAAFHKSSEAGLRARMESLVYLVLAATNANDDGTLSVDDDPGDPRLGQPGSGIYAHVHGDLSDWSSPSSMTVDLPRVQQARAGESIFEIPSDENNYYRLHYGVRFETRARNTFPVTVSIMVHSRELQPELQAFRTGLWRSLGVVGVILLLAQLVLLTLGLRPLRRITQDISAVE